MDKELFRSAPAGALAPPADTQNRAGGKAYTRSPKESLAQYAATCMFGGTYYVSSKEQLTEVLALAKECDPVFVAKCAVYARQNAWLKDTPAVLLAHVFSQARLKFDDNGARRAFRQAFPIVIDNSKMLRNFFTVVRSGVTGRKSFGSGSARFVASWFDRRTDRQLFLDQVGNAPTLRDMLRLWQPKPATPERKAYYRYLKGHELTAEEYLSLPAVAKGYEDFKNGRHTNEREAAALEVPDVDFRQLDSLRLSEAEWKQVFRRGKWQFTRMNLNTALRQGVLNDPEMVTLIAERLRDPDEVRRSRNFPYQIFQAYLEADAGVPMEIQLALQDAMEVATENVPAFEGNIVVALDVSGSMSGPVAKASKGKPASKMRCVDAAALFAAALMRKNPRALLFPFGTDLHLDHRVNPRDSIVTIAKQLGGIQGGGTNCALPLQYLNGMNEKRWAATGIDAVIYLSDNESWIERGSFGYSGAGTTLMTEWNKLRVRNPNAKLVCVDITSGKDVQAPNAPERLNIGGFNDDVFRSVQRFLQSGSADHWVNEIEAIDLDSPSFRG